MAAHDRIVPLDQLDDFQVSEHDPDVRGWEVLGMDGRKIGEVDQLLVDTTLNKVRYLDVDIEDGLAPGEDRHILVPIGYARLGEENEQVFVDRLTSGDLIGLPAYTAGSVTPDFESDLERRFAGTTTPTTARTGEARVTLSEEELAVGKRERVAGAVEIDKDVETRHVRENVPVRHEEVVIERRDAAPGATASPRIEEGEIHIPVTEEELIVQKRTVPREELVVRKQEVVEDRTVEADLRREHAEVHREGDVDVRDDRR